MSSCSVLTLLDASSSGSILSIFALFDIFQHLSKEGVVAVLTFTDERFNYKPQTPGQENEQLNDIITKNW